VSSRACSRRLSHLHGRASTLNIIKWKPWHKCARCLRRLGYGSVRLSRVFPAKQKTIKRFLQQRCSDIPRPSTPVFRKERPAPKPKPQFQNPIVRCGQCLFFLGFGYHRIATQLFGKFSKQSKHRIACWRKTHKWTSPFNNLECLKRAYRYANPFPIKPPKPPKPDPLYVQKRHRLKVYLRRKVWGFFKHGLHPKSTASLIGCSRATLHRHLSRQFLPGMTFENYGPVWHIDHISPCKLYNLFNLQERLACFHYTNLQPMFAHDNRTKSASGSRQLTLV
jgi:hypothetical protein